jgi:hypothetical protein
LKIAEQRLYNQGISHIRFENPHDVVQWHGAMQGQEYHSVKWALALRTQGYTDKVLDKLFDEGAFIRTHVMRPTWHLVAPEDIRWLLKLTAPRVHQANAYMYRQTELDAAVFRQSHEILTKALEGGREKTRTQLAADLAEAGIRATDVRLGYIMMEAELEGLICNGSRKGRQFTYALLEERIPPAKNLDTDEALAELTRRYFTSHAPASIYDFSWWSGLTIAEVKKGLSMLEGEFIEEDGYWRSANPETAADVPMALLLPAYDEYGVAYKDHSATLSAEFIEKATTSVFGGTIVIYGHVVGYWKRAIEKKHVEITLMPFRPLSSDELEAVTIPAEAYARFHELALNLRVQES